MFIDGVGQLFFEQQANFSHSLILIAHLRFIITKFALVNFSRSVPNLTTTQLCSKGYNIDEHIGVAFGRAVGT